MKTHVAFLALSVLCLESAVFGRFAAAQTPPDSVKISPAAPEMVPAPEAPSPPAPPTPVDTAPPTPVNTEPSPVLPPAPPAAAPPLLVWPAPAPLLVWPAPAPPPAVGAVPALPGDPTAVAGVVRGLGAPRYRDAHHDRLLLSPTAETNPKGSFYVTGYELVVLQMGYAVSDNTQLSITMTPPLGEAGAIPGDLSLKTVLLREAHVTVAAVASATGVVGFEEFSGFLGRAGGVVTFCAEARECRLSFSMSSNLSLIGPASLLFSGVGLSFRAGRYVALIAELDTLIPLGELAGEANGFLGAAGVRLSGRSWGVDLALLKAGKADAEPSNILPFVAATYRYVP